MSDLREKIVDELVTWWCAEGCDEHRKDAREAADAVLRVLAEHGDTEQVRLEIAGIIAENSALSPLVMADRVMAVVAQLVASRDAALGLLEMLSARPRVTPKVIEEQRAKGWPDWHPEDYCHRCGERNIKPWYVDSALWNEAAEANEILCPQCFVEAYEAATGQAPVWRLAPVEQSDEKAALVKSEAAMRHERDRLRGSIWGLIREAETRQDSPPAVDVSALRSILAVDTEDYARRLAEWHPHSAVGALKLMRAEADLAAARQQLDALRRHRSITEGFDAPARPAGHDESGQ